MKIRNLLLNAAAVAAFIFVPSAQAQTSAPVVPVVPVARAASSAASSAASASQKIEVTGTRVGDEEQRRRSTAAKIVIGREEIERFGDSSVSEVLKRLPGITVSGARLCKFSNKYSYLREFNY